MGQSTLERQLAAIEDLRARGILTDEEARARRLALLAEPGDENAEGSQAVLAIALAGAGVGLAFALIALIAGDVADDGEIVGLGVSALVSALVGGGAGICHSLGRWRTGMAALLVVAALWHLVSISLFGIPGFVVLLIAGIVAFLERD